MNENEPATAPRRARLTPLALAWLTLGVNAVVILQGAFVRATGSGAGCGSHWPTCGGEVIPLSGGVATTIEFSHRLLSLAALLMGVWLFRRALALRSAQPGLFAFAAAALAFVIVEALLGAATVLWGLTGENQSVARGLMVSTHLVNSLFLVGTLAGAVVFARERAPSWPLRIERQGGVATVLAVGLVGMVVLMFSGGIASMGSTMFPAETLAGGLAADFDPDAHPLVRLRILHPLIAVSVGVYLFVALGLAWWLKPVPAARRIARMLLAVYLVQLAVGTLNLALLAPVALQLTHLALAVLAFGLLCALGVVLLGSPARARSPLSRAVAEAQG